MTSRALRSRAWSCSELEGSNAALLKTVKQEAGVSNPAEALDEELEKDPLCKAHGILVPSATRCLD